MMQRSINYLPKFWRFACSIFTEPPQNNTTELGIDHLIIWNEFSVHNGHNEHTLHVTVHLSASLGVWRVRTFPLIWLLFSFWSIIINPVIRLCDENIRDCRLPHPPTYSPDLAPCDFGHQFRPLSVFVFLGITPVLVLLMINIIPVFVSAFVQLFTLRHNTRPSAKIRLSSLAAFSSWMYCTNTNGFKRSYKKQNSAHWSFGQ